MKQELMKKYADFAVRTGTNVQKGQTLIINAPIEGAFFARACAEAAYAAGAREVVVHYADEKLSRIKMEHTALDVLEDVKPWQLRRYMDYAEGPGGACVLKILAEDPEIYKGLDTHKIEKASQAASKAMMPWRKLTMASKIQWSIAAIPSPAWAEKIFPGVPVDEAQEKLWDVIFKVCRVENGNPVAEWKQHTDKLQGYTDALNAMCLQSIHLKSDNGTDLTVGLADNHIWCGALEESADGVPFLANAPTEEVFTAPHRAKTNGVVKSSLPYVYNGNLIEGIKVRFENGVAVEYSAEKGDELLRQMLSSDEGALHLGEIALVPASSPIRQSGLLFYNTLFDENAACHMAFGAGYPTTVKDGGDMTTEQLLALGVNDSLIHEDVMIGTEDMDITGLTAQGETVQIFKNGEWAL